MHAQESVSVCYQSETNKGKYHVWFPSLSHPFVLSYVLVIQAAIPMAAMPTPSSSQAAFTDVMAFSGSVPEITNGRLAMIGVIAALGAEFASGESVLRQLADEPTGIILVFLLIIIASVVPALSKTPPETFGPFTPNAELLNGRAAMLGFASLLAIEFARGVALF
jgi:succinate dehydrogenase hydrophobic anchor subunit